MTHTNTSPATPTSQSSPQHHISLPNHVIFQHLDTFEYLHSNEYRRGYPWLYNGDLPVQKEGQQHGKQEANSQSPGKLSLFHSLYPEKYHNQLDVLDEALMRIPSLLTIRRNLTKSQMEQENQTDSSRPIIAFPSNFQRHRFLPECLYKPVVKNSELFSNFQSHLKSFYVLIDEKCAESVLRGSDVFAVGVIATNIPKSNQDTGLEVTVLMRKRLDELQNHSNGEEKHSDNLTESQETRTSPRAILKGQLMPASYEDLLKEYAPSHIFSFIANGVTCLSRKNMFKSDTMRFEQPGVQITERLYHGVEQLSPYMSAEYFPQTLASMLAARALQVEPHHRVCDTCCAPGGKLTHISHLMNNEGEIVAFERSKRRFTAVKKTLKQQGISNVRVVNKDFSQCLKKNLVEKESFDRILCDLPCTGLGNLNLFYSYSMKDVISQGEYQQKLLKVALQLLKVGGELLFSTCSLFPQENEMNVAQLLETYGSDTLELVDLHQEMSNTFGHEHWGTYQESKPAFGHEQILKNGLHRRVIRFDPCIHDETIGFFMARFRKLKSLDSS